MDHNDPKDHLEFEDSPPRISRRKFLQAIAAAGATGYAALSPLGVWALEPVQEVGNPLEHYPDRGWEKIYLDQYRFDRTFTYICSPNDTHECRVRAFVRNGVVIRLEQNYDHHKIKDLYGNQATAHWNPRMCLKGFTFHRRVYGPYRLKYPMIRRGWKQWADDGFPSLSDNPELRNKYKFTSRGTDEFVRVSWDEVNTYLANALIATAKTYSGAEGKRRLLADGYPTEMLEHWGEAGTRVMKFRGGMGMLGVIGKYGLYRFANMMALLDVHVRGVDPEKALGSRNWSNYTWHGDQAPGHPFVHGLQTSDIDLNDYRNSKFTVHVGKNMIENKMPEAHWLTEMIERGGRIAVIAPEYNPPATKADYWIPVRAGLSDTSIFLYVTKTLMDKGWVDYDFVKKFTDFPLLVRTDTLKRLRAQEVFRGYKPGLTKDGPSFATQGLEEEQYKRLGDFVVFDKKKGSMKAVTRDDVGERLTAKGIEPELEWKGKVKLVDGSEVEVWTLWEMYKVHLQEYDLETVSEITGAPKNLLERLAEDFGRRFWDRDFMGKGREAYPISVHYGEGINHYFHATLHNRATYLPLMLVGSIGVPGSGAHTWAGNYKTANFQASKWSGPGFKGWVAEDPFHPPLLDPAADGQKVTAHAYSREEEVGYWAHADRPLIVETAKYGRKVFTGKTHLPTPTKVMWFTNVNLINNAKWAYHLIKYTNPLIDLIVTQDIEWTASAEYADAILPANSWMEFENYEVTSSCSNPFLQIWKGGIKPLYDTLDDVMIYVGMAEKLADLTGDRRFADYWKFASEKRTEIYIQRLLDGSTTTRGYKVQEILDGKFGEPGAALMLFRTYPRVPFWEQVYESLPFHTDTGRLHAYCDIPEAIEHGENFVVHREGPEATLYLPNVIVSSNPFIRPDNQGFTQEMLERGEGLDWQARHVANNKLPWSKVKETRNPLWEKGYRFLCSTPKSRHTVHSQWAVTDWNWIWSQNFGDPYRMDKRQPGVNDWQIHMNPQAAKDLGINDGDYVYVDADPANRPYIGANSEDPFYKVSRLMLRVKYNPSYPYHFTMMKHASFIATERTVKAHEERPDGRALSPTGYQASFRYGSQQSLTISWLMPMHQTDSLFHKKKSETAFTFGYEADNHGINSVPKETLIRIAKAEDGGLGGKGVWEPARTGFSPGNESDFMQQYLRGDLLKVKT